MVELLAGLIGLTAYVALAGGVREWGRLSAAGLPATFVLDDIQPRVLLADGFQALLVLPVTFALVLVVVQAEADVRKSERQVRKIQRWAAGTWSAVTQIGIAVVALLIGAFAAFFLIAILLWAWFALPDSRVSVWGASIFVAVATTYIVAVATWRGMTAMSRLSEPSQRDGDGEAERVERPFAGDPLRALPGVVRYPAEFALRTATWAWMSLGAVVGAGSIVGLTAVAVSDGDPAWVFLCFGLLTVLVATAALVYGGPRRLLSLERPEEPLERAWYLPILPVLVLAILFASIPLGVAALGVILIVVLGPEVDAPDASEAEDDRPIKRPDVLGRAAVAAALITLCAIASGIGSPERFDRIDIGMGSSSVQAAIVGKSSDSYVLGLCDREKFENLGRTWWRSKNPVTMRIPVANARDAVIRRGGYTFFQTSEPSLGGALLSLFRLPTLRSPSVSSQAPSPVKNVCGDQANPKSVAENREAIRSLTAKEPGQR